LESLVYSVSDKFYKLVSRRELGVEPLLVVDRSPANDLHRFFLVRYLIGEGRGGESKRLLMRNELTGYNYEVRRLYLTQHERLDGQQLVMEPYMYGSSGVTLARITLQDISTCERELAKAVLSEDLVTRLIGLYEFGW
jgi:hypothetical protein